MPLFADGLEFNRNSFEKWIYNATFTLGVCVEESFTQNATCTEDMDCYGGMSCVNGLCTLVEPCISLQCRQEEFCRQAACLRDNENSPVQCTQDEDCYEGYACSSLGVCVDPYDPLHECDEKVSCGSKARCQNGTCAPLPEPGKKFKVSKYKYNITY